MRPETAHSHVPMPSSASMPWDWFHINAVHGMGTYRAYRLPWHPAS